MTRPRPDHTRRCPVRACGIPLETEEALCGGHWWRLATHKRERIKKAWALSDGLTWARLMREAVDSLNDDEMSNKGMGNG